MRHVLHSLSLLAVAGAALLLGEATASAQPYYGPAYGPPPSYRAAPRYAAPYTGYGYHTHDGFFLRLNAGFGYLTASEDYGGGDEVTYSGMGGSYGVALGGALAPNLILYGEMLGTTVVNADYRDTGGVVGLSGYDVTMFGFGPGIAYYLQPANVYFSGTLAISKVSFSFTDVDYDDSAGETDFGIGLSFMCGKEWWITRDWGIGIAGRLHWANMRDTLLDTRINSLAASLLFSATYN